MSEATKTFSFNAADSERVYNPYEGAHTDTVANASLQANLFAASAGSPSPLVFNTDSHSSQCYLDTGLGLALERNTTATFKLPKQPEFLFSEEAAVKRRSWSENLTYYTGVGYGIGELQLLRKVPGLVHQSTHHPPSPSPPHPPTPPTHTSTSLPSQPSLPL
jgi:hypothetical protein